MQKRLRELAQVMSTQLRAGGEFSAGVTETLTKIESLSDEKQLEAIYVERVVAAIRRRLRGLNLSGFADTRDTDALRQEIAAIDDEALSQLPRSMSTLDTWAQSCKSNPNCQVPKHLDLVAQAWKDSGEADLRELLGAKAALLATLTLETGSDLSQPDRGCEA